MTKFSYIIFIGLLIFFTSCRKDFSTDASSGNLEFSKTTVYLDTVFSTIGSSTYSLKVYNRSNDAIKIPTIQLAKGLNSKYRMIVLLPAQPFRATDVTAINQTALHFQ